MTYLRGRGPRFVTVCDIGGVKFVKSSLYIRYEQPLISKDHNYTQKQYFEQIQQILDVTFDFTGAARGVMIMSCAARGVKKVGQHCITQLNKMVDRDRRCWFFCLVKLFCW